MTAYTAITKQRLYTETGSLSLKLATEFGLIGDMLAGFDVEASLITISRALKLSAKGGASAAKAQLLGIGTAVSPATSSVVDGKFIEMRCETTAASGDNRLAYMRYFIAGAGGGECVRGSTVINENTGTAHGAHFGIEFKAEAGGSECSGLGVGLRGTFMIPNIASWAPTGTYAAGMFEIYSEGDASDPAGMTELSVLRLVNGGDTTGAVDVDTDAFLLSIQGFTSGTGKMIEVGTGMGTVTGTLKCKLGASTVYLPYYSSPG